MEMTMTATEKRIYKTLRLHQLFGLVGRYCGDTLEQLAILCPDSADSESVDQPLKGITEAQLPQARELVKQLPQTTATEHWLYLTQSGPYPYVGV